MEDPAAQYGRSLNQRLKLAYEDNVRAYSFSQANYY